MAQTLDELYAALANTYKKDTDQDFPTNKIRFFMDFLWNAILAKQLTEEQKTALKGLIDLLNSLDDHKLSPLREMLGNLNAQLTPLLATYPSLGHTFTFAATTLLPSYQKYLTSLEGLVKDSHAFTKEEVLLYYDMTLIDHAVLSHLFETESSLNLVEIITSIKSIIQVNALTHDYLQDALGRSISLFTFLQRGGLAKEKCHDYYVGLVDDILALQRQTVTLETANQAVEHLCKKLIELTMNATTAQTTAPSAQPEIAQLDALLQEQPTPTPMPTPVAPEQTVVDMSQPAPVAPPTTDQP